MSSTIKPVQKLTRVGEQSTFAQESEFCSKLLPVINDTVAKLSTFTARIGTANDSTALRAKLQSMRDSLDTQVKSATNCVDRMRKKMEARNPLERNHMEKMSGEVGNTQRTYRSAIQRLESSLADHPRAPITPPPSKRPLPAQPSPPNFDESTSLMQAHQQQQQQQLAKETEMNMALIMEREQAVLEIEETMKTVNAIYRDLAMMIDDQGRVIDTIEKHMESTVVNVEDGNKQLTVAVRYQASSKKCMCWILLIVAIIAAILITVLVTKLHN